MGFSLGLEGMLHRFIVCLSICLGVSAELKAKEVAALFYGDGCAGRSSLIKAFKGQPSEHSPQTPILEITHIEGEALAESGFPGFEDTRFHLIDLGGQVDYRGVTRRFIREAALIVLAVPQNTFFCDNHPSAKRALQRLTVMMAKGQKIRVLIVFTKRDNAEDITGSERSLLWSLACEYPFLDIIPEPLLTSAKNKLGLQELLQKIAELGAVTSAPSRAELDAFVEGLRAGPRPFLVKSELSNTAAKMHRVSAQCGYTLQLTEHVILCKPEILRNLTGLILLSVSLLPPKQLWTERHMQDILTRIDVYEPPHRAEDTHALSLLLNRAHVENGRYYTIPLHHVVALDSSVDSHANGDQASLPSISVPVPAHFDLAAFQEFFAWLSWSSLHVKTLAQTVFSVENGWKARITFKDSEISFPREIVLQGDNSCCYFMLCVMQIFADRYYPMVQFENTVLQEASIAESDRERVQTFLRGLADGTEAAYAAIALGKKPFDVYNRKKLKNSRVILESVKQAAASCSNAL